ncbi:MAG: diguanylate cyclase [Candidatus Omnitrophica bacterium]|nr:diguanylate cyclase [Candidatus Omnitrophota bacterium]
MKNDNRIKILLVEDDPDDFFIIQQFLKSSKAYSFEVVNQDRHEKAMAFLAQELPDMVLLDLSLPDCQGIQSFENLHRSFPELPVVILTGLDDRQMAFDAVSKGAQDYLPKGQIDAHLLEKAILYAIERSRIQKELNSANRTLEHLLSIDPLTELLNRRGLQRALSETAAKYERFGVTSYAFLLDLDDFKKINDTYGHSIGDIVLKEIARRIRETVRPTDHVARIGGDEFIINLPETREAEAMNIAHRIRRVIAQTQIAVSETEIIHVTGSVGVVSIMEQELSVDELIESSHLALSKSKKAGKNRVTFKQPDAVFETKDEDVMNVLQKMKSGKNLYAVMQPIFNLRTKKKTGYEILSRMAMSEFGMPDNFFRLSIEANILTVVDRLCLKVCLKAASACASDLIVHVNLFPSTMIDVPTEQIVDDFKTIGEGRNFCLEISEQQIIGDSYHLIQPVRAFRQAGIRIAIDDVGFGRSSLESLILLEPDVVKIDKKFVKDIHKNESKRHSLTRLLNVINGCNARAIAEGIEDEEDLRILMDMGIPEGQGFLLGKPSKDPDGMTF